VSSESLHAEPASPVVLASRLVAYTAIATGVVWLFVVVVGGCAAFVYDLMIGEYESASVWSMATEIMLMLFILTIVSVPGVISLEYGRRPLKSATVETVREAVGVIAFLSAILLYFGIEQAFFLITTTKLPISPPILFTTIIVMLPVYAFVCGQILKHDGIEFRGYGDILTKHLLLVSAWLMWFSLSGVVSPTALRAASANPELMLIVFGMPILMAWGFYRFSMRWLGHERRGSDDSFRLRKRE